MITMKDAEVTMYRVFEECNKLRQEGQKEYAHTSTNALANFERGANLAGVPRETVLFIYMSKHFDGISSWIKGHRSQRENVKGRINDMIVYLVLLRAMVDDSEDGLVPVASFEIQSEAAYQSKINSNLTGPTPPRTLG